MFDYKGTVQLSFGDEEKIVSLRHIDTHVLICRIPHLENFSGNNKNFLLAQINKCKQIFVLNVHKNA